MYIITLRTYVISDIEYMYMNMTKSESKTNPRHIGIHEVVYIDIRIYVYIHVNSEVKQEKPNMKRTQRKTTQMCEQIIKPTSRENTHNDGNQFKYKFKQNATVRTS